MDRHQVAVEILRRFNNGDSGDLPAQALIETADVLFRALDAEEASMPRAECGSVWIVDLGIVATVRPCLVLSIPTDPQDRSLATLVPHTTSLQGTRFEVAVPAKFLQVGSVFDAQQVVTVLQVKLICKLGDLPLDNWRWWRRPSGSGLACEWQSHQGDAVQGAFAKP